MSDNELEKTFVERPPITSIPSAYGGNVTQPHSRPIIGQTQFGSSVVTEIIGEGGMATVYKVWNERLDVFRAVKLLSQEAYSARFETEAQITAKLRHDGIVEIHNIGEWNGLPYMEMEFVDGSDLQKTLNERGKLPETVCVAIATLVAEALAHAHTKTFTLVGKQYCGIIHRDLKPANIMISKQGAVKLTDFGIARPTQASLHTVEGNIAGTMHYLSPEQMDGGTVDNRSDIYSFGAVLYEMVTGAKTFPQESITELMKQKSVNNFKPLDEYDIPVNEELAKIILRCLNFDPDKRYQRTKDLVSDLQKLNTLLTNQTPKEVLEDYFDKTENAGGTDSGKTKIQLIPGKLKTAGKSIISRTSKKIILITSLSLFALFLLLYLAAKIFSARSPLEKALSSTTVISDSTTESDDELISDDIATSAIPKTEIETYTAPSPARSTTPVSAPATTPPSRPAATTADSKSEDELLRAAAAAINARRWNQAIQILEQDGVFKRRNDHRTLYLFNAYVEAWQFNKAKAILDTASLAITQDAYFLLSAGKYWLYRENTSRAIGLFESSLLRTSIVETKNILPYAAVFFIADTRHQRFMTTPSAANKAAALEAWQDVRTVFAAKPNDERAKRAVKEIEGLRGGN